MAQNGSEGPKMAQIKPERTERCLEWPRVDKWTKRVPMWPKVTKHGQERPRVAENGPSLQLRLALFL